MYQTKTVLIMENKINIAELLRDCPKGMELDCSIFEDVTLHRIDTNIENDFPIRIKTKNDYFLDLTKYGTYSNVEEAKCVIFPRGKNTWEGFHRPFKDGDILVVADTIYIYNGIEELSPYPSHYVYVIADKNGLFAINTSTKKYGTRFATEEEKQKLFKAIKENGYQWNTETKTLNKLPKFEVGDKIVKKNDVCVPILITKVSDEFYYSNTESSVGVLSISEQDNYELVSNKFDITTLKPFDKVLVRNEKHHFWFNAFFGVYKKDSNAPFVCCNGFQYTYCIPYEGNQHLLGTTNDCNEFYETWKE